MAGRRRRATEGETTSRAAARAAAIADQLHSECGLLLELYRKKESLGPDLVLSDLLLVSVLPASSQLEVQDQLGRIISALDQCHCLLERAIAREEQAVGVTVVGKAEYQKQRKTVKDRLALLLASTRGVLKRSSGTAALTTTTNCQEPDGSTVLFEVKMWIYRIYRELEYWSKATITLLQAPAGPASVRMSTRRRRNMR
ncbi:ciliary neurotrophic factor [Gadus chalcogrammus]|uniref:ciliary neurotrophic factor n=1 Tax=Gadus chalcogrammus TaxID=1042646 RepID=UPI0024C4449B|nr:ciliary neurotrophic factor [Gadus chalcogrammus]